MPMGEPKTLLVPREREGGWKHIHAACQHRGIEVHDYDIYGDSWIEQASSSNAIGCIYRPEFRYESWRQIFRERIAFLNIDLKIPVYPTLNELNLYESKRRMSYWLKANDVPHSRTYVFCNHHDALAFVASAKFPLIHKTDFGNCGHGVRVLNNRKQALKVLEGVFCGGYTPLSYAPDRLDVFPRLKHAVRPAYNRLFRSRQPPADKEVGSAIFQEFVDIATEWRVVKIGRYFFGHDKLPNERGLRSGGGMTSWAIPPTKVFDFARSVCDTGSFGSMALDLFEDKVGTLYVNELQTVFGVAARNQMYRLAG